MLKVYAVNGSPRKAKNTDTLLTHVLEGVNSKDNNNITTEKIHIYDYVFSGCKSCFQCKRINGSHYGKCAVSDGLKPVLEKLDDADAIVFGSPVYLTSISGQLQCLMERFLFPKLSYDEPIVTIAKKKMLTAFVYTMNVTQEGMNNADYIRNFTPLLTFVERLLTKPKTLYAYNTLQFDDYDLYFNKRYSQKEKAAWHETQFPKDCERAFDLGCEIFREIIQSSKEAL